MKTSLVRLTVILLIGSLLVAACQSAPQKQTSTTPTNGTIAPQVTNSSIINTQRADVSPSTTPQPTSQITLDDEDIRGQVITLWHPWSGNYGALMKTLVDEFNLQNEWGVIVVPVYQGNLDELSNTLRDAVQATETPDLAVGLLHQALGWNELHPLVDLEPYLKDIRWGLSQDMIQAMYPALWEGEIVESKRLGIPAQRSAQLLLYNQSWGRELGYTRPPINPQEFEEQACSAAQKMLQDEDLSNDGTGGWIISTDYAAILSWAYSFGAEIIIEQDDSAQANVYQVDSSEMEESFTYLRNLLDRGCAWQASTPYPTVEFASRQGLFSHINLSDLTYQEKAFMDLDNPDTWLVISYPSLENSPYLDVYGASFYMLESSPERQLAAWVFLRWLLQTENQARWIQVTGGFPLTAEIFHSLQGYQKANPQWAAAVDLLSRARPEPALRSWEIVRWAFEDAATQLFRSYFSIDQVPNLIDYLDATVQELHSGIPSEEIEFPQQNTPTP